MATTRPAWSVLNKMEMMTISLQNMVDLADLQIGAEKYIGWDQQDQADASRAITAQSNADLLLLLDVLCSPS